MINASASKTIYFDVVLEFPKVTFAPVKWETQGTGITSTAKRLKEICKRYYPDWYGDPKITLTPKGI